jgi:hypothetical protein
VITHRQHLLTAAIIWVMVATMLIVRGTIWVVSNQPLHHAIIVGVLLVVGLGVLKGRYVVSRMAGRMVSHIQQLQERSPVWQVYSGSTYLSILLMVGIGIACRFAGAHWHMFWLIGYIYAAVGIALLTGSGVFWRELHRR